MRFMDTLEEGPPGEDGNCQREKYSRAGPLVPTAAVERVSAARRKVLLRGPTVADMGDVSANSAMISSLRCSWATGFLAVAGCWFPGGPARGAPLPLTESTFTEIIQEAKVIAAASKAETPAETNMLF